MQEVTIASQTGDLAAQVYEAEKSDRILVIGSATGVKQNYYGRFAEFVNQHGISAITFDYSGIGNSINKPLKAYTHNVVDWGRKDFESVLSYVTKRFENQKLLILGHSIGGQLIGLTASSLKAHRIILMASQSGYWKRWYGRDKLKMWANWNIIIPVTVSLFGYLPSKKISGMENLPPNVALQWRNWCMHEDYLFSEVDIDSTNYPNIKCPITAYSIDDDVFATKEAVDWMVNKYSSAPMNRIHLMPSDLSVKDIGHFGVFKEKFQNTIWQKLLKDLKS